MKTLCVRETGLTYKTVEINKKLDNKNIEAIKGFSQIYPHEDIWLDYDKDRILIYLRSLDLKRFKKASQEIIKSYKLEEKDTPFPAILEKIEKIGSYGIKGDKRIFIDYNKERKVKNRKEKEKQRVTY